MIKTLLIAALLIGFIAAFVWFLVASLKRQKKKQASRFLDRLHRLGSEHHLNFSSQEVLQEGIIGLDGVHRKLLFLQENGEGPIREQMVDLQEVKTCTVRKDYNMTAFGSGKGSKWPHYLEKIILVLSYPGKKDPVEITFYSHLQDQLFQADDLEKRARHWEKALSGILG